MTQTQRLTTPKESKWPFYWYLWFYWTNWSQTTFGDSLLIKRVDSNAESLTHDSESMTLNSKRVKMTLSLISLVLLNRFESNHFWQVPSDETNWLNQNQNNAKRRYTRIRACCIPRRWFVTFTKKCVLYVNQFEIKAYMDESTIQKYSMRTDKKGKIKRNVLYCLLKLSPKFDPVVLRLSGRRKGKRLKRAKNAVYNRSNFCNFILKNCWKHYFVVENGFGFWFRNLSWFCVNQTPKVEKLCNASTLSKNLQLGIYFHI